MDSPLRVFVTCGDILQGSYFEVLFHQLPDGAVPKLAADRKMNVDGRALRVSLTTDSGLAQYPARLLDMFRQADVIVFLYSLVDRAVFEGLPERFEWVSGPARDFEPATFIMLGVIPSNAGDTPHVISPQEVDSMCSQYSATNYQLDTRVKHKDLDELWSFVVRSHAQRVKSSSTAPSSSSSSAASAAALSPRSQVLAKEETLVQLTATLITKKEAPADLTKAVGSQSAKKTEKILKQAIKSTGKREILSVTPSRIDLTHANLLEPSFLTFTITTSSKAPINWAISDAETVSNAHFLAVHEASGSVSKSKPATVTICCTFYQPAELSRFILVDCPQEPGLSAPLFVKLAAPLQPRDPLSYWTISRKAISIGFRISSTLSANVYRSTLYGAVVAVKEWSLDPSTGRPPDLFFTEWDAFVKLKHPNIAQFLGGSKERGEAFMVLEYLKYGQLGTFLHNPPPRGVVRTIDLRLKMATDLAKAMAYLHSQKMLHRDLTSANVLVDSDCSVKLGDFGEPRQIGVASQLSLNSTYGGRSDFGTGGNASSGESLDWTAPELLATNGTNSHSQKSDVFSYGVILWEFGSERVPARTLADVRAGVLPSLPMDVKTRYPAFNDLVTQCTNISAELRPTFDEIVTRLETIRSNGPALLAPAPIGKGPSPASNAPPSSKYLPPPAFSPTSGNSSAAPSRILYRGQIHGSPKQPISHQGAPGHADGSGAPPASQRRLVDAVILPELSIGPTAQQPPSALVSPQSQPQHVGATSPTAFTPLNVGPQAHSSVSMSLTHTAEHGVMPASGPATPPVTSTTSGAVSPSNSQASSPLLGHALQGGVGINGAQRVSPPPSIVASPRANGIASPRDGSTASSAAEATASALGGLSMLPAAVPLNAPPRAAAAPAQMGSYALPTPPPVLSQDVTNGGLATANSLPLLRLPSLSQFNAPTPLSPQAIAALSPHRGPLSPNASTSTAAAEALSPRANAKDDNLLNWASDAYDHHDGAAPASPLSGPQRTNTAPVQRHAPMSSTSIPSSSAPPTTAPSHVPISGTSTLGPRVPFVPAPLFSPRTMAGQQTTGASPRVLPPAPQAAAPSSATSPTKPSPLQ